MVLDILCDRLGAKNCIKVAGKFKFRRRFHLGMTEDELAVEDTPESTEEPVYDPAIHELAHEDAEFGPGVHPILHEDTETEMNKSFINVIR